MQREEVLQGEPRVCVVTSLLMATYLQINLLFIFGGNTSTPGSCAPYMILATLYNSGHFLLLLYLPLWIHIVSRSHSGPDSVLRYITR